MFAKWSMLGDINGDCQINSTDLEAVSEHYSNDNGQSNWNAEFDLNYAGFVDIFDIVLVAKAFDTK